MHMESRNPLVKSFERGGIRITLTRTMDTVTLAEQKDPVFVWLARVLADGPFKAPDVTGRGISGDDALCDLVVNLVEIAMLPP